MTRLRRPATLPERLGLAVLAGTAGGALTFVNYQQAVYPDALPTPEWLPAVLLLSVGVLVGTLRLEMRSMVWAFVVALPASFAVYLLLTLAPQLLAGWSASQLLFFLVYGTGGRAFTAWLFMFPTLLAGGLGGHLLWTDGPFS
ncbi:hypothetical protein [Halorarum halobium]|uniref:hypothetical protein n=1 Tax=Halorarum halobium TaxID=3075121 RepID=UPI0028B1EF5C|nr:hypothetical protein [Halobaculum sp. XH14]